MVSKMLQALLPGVYQVYPRGVELKEAIHGIKARCPLGRRPPDPLD